MPSLKPYLQFAGRRGACWTRAVRASVVVCAAWVRFKCRYGCDYYDQKRCCPPRTPTPEETAAVVRCYRRAILAVWEAPPALRERRQARRRMQQSMRELERALFLDGFYKALAFVAGPCTLCARCDLDEPCKHPGDPRPSMESCGMDVYATLANAGYRLRVVTDPAQNHRMCGLVLVD